MTMKSHVLDRGHMALLYRYESSRWYKGLDGTQSMSESFYLTNMVPTGWLNNNKFGQI